MVRAAHGQWYMVRRGLESRIGSAEVSRIDHIDRRIKGCLAVKRFNTVRCMSST